MVRSFLRLACLLACLACPAAASTNAPLSLGEFQHELSRHLASERFSSAQWGVKIVSLESRAVLFETNAAKLLKPASNAKLYTAALALDTFGPDHRIRTSLLAEKAPRKNGSLPCDLVIYGRGDFSMSARFHNGSHSNLLAGVVAEIKRAGIRDIRGDLVGDETFFRGPRAGSGWTWDDLNYYYGAEVSALTLQDNTVDLLISPRAVGSPCAVELKPATGYLSLLTRPLTVAGGGPHDLAIYRPLGGRDFHIFGALASTNPPVAEAVSVPNPALWFVTMLREALQREGIQVRGKVRSIGWPERAPYRLENLREIGFVQSKPMRDLVAKMLKPSQNLYAQLLLLQAGALRPETGLTETLGIRALRDFLLRASIDPRQVLLEEGSGLSRSCLVTANATVQLLQHMAGHPHSADFAEALPEPGGEGTLRRRLLDLKGKVRAKTGTLRYVNALSGYATTETGERVAFSLMLNAYNPPPGAVEPRNDLDAIPRLISRLRLRP